MFTSWIVLAFTETSLEHKPDHGMFHSVIHRYNHYIIKSVCFCFWNLFQPRYANIGLHFSGFLTPTCPPVSVWYIRPCVREWSAPKAAELSFSSTGMTKVWIAFSWHFDWIQRIFRTQAHKRFPCDVWDMTKIKLLRFSIHIHPCLVAHFWHSPCVDSSGVRVGTLRFLLNRIHVLHRLETALACLTEMHGIFGNHRLCIFVATMRTADLSYMSVANGQIFGNISKHPERAMQYRELVAANFRHHHPWNVFCYEATRDEWLVKGAFYVVFCVVWLEGWLAEYSFSVNSFA